MSRLPLRLAVALAAMLALSACTESDSPTSPSGTGIRDTPVPGGPRDTGLPGGTSGGGDTTTTNPGDTTTTNPADTIGAGDPVNNGTWTRPDSDVAADHSAGGSGAYDPRARGTRRHVGQQHGPDLQDVGPRALRRRDLRPERLLDRSGRQRLRPAQPELPRLRQRRRPGQQRQGAVRDPSSSGAGALDQSGRAGAPTRSTRSASASGHRSLRSP